MNLYGFVFNDPSNLRDAFGLEVVPSEPGALEGLIPVWGSARQALRDFYCGRLVWGVVNTFFAVTDVTLVRSIVFGSGKFLLKQADTFLGSAGSLAGKLAGGSADNLAGALGKSADDLAELAAKGGDDVAQAAAKAGGDNLAEAGAKVAAGVAMNAAEAASRSAAGAARHLDEAGEVATRVAPFGGVCFAEGTPIATAQGMRPIETLRIGQRVLTSEADSTTQIQPEKWRAISLRMANPEQGADVLEIDLLRPQGWLEENGCREGEILWLELEDMGLKGFAQVLNVGVCPPIEGGEGRVILARVTHLNSFVQEVQLEGGRPPLKPTDRHRLFSETRGTWVEASKLTPGEELRTADGTRKVISVRRLEGARRVYNLEVETEHCYFAGHEKVLSHNTNPCAATASVGSKVAGIAAKGTLSPSLQIQKELSLQANRQGAVIDRWLGASNSRWAQLYRSIESTNPNFAKGIRGRFLDVRMRSKFRDLFGHLPGVRIGQTIPGSGSSLRPDLYLPDIGGKSFIFDVGGPSKIGGILKYGGMADYLVPLVPVQWML